MDGKIIREERLSKIDDQSKLVSTNFLKKEVQTEKIFNKHGDIISINGRKIKYKYDDNGVWILKNRNGFSTKRVIYY